MIDVLACVTIAVPPCIPDPLYDPVDSEDPEFPIPPLPPAPPIPTTNAPGST